MGDSEKVEEVFVDAYGGRGKEDSRLSKRQKCGSGEGSCDEDDIEKMKEDIILEMRRIMREEMLSQMRAEMREMMSQAMKDVMREAVREEMKPVLEMMSKVEKKVVGVEEEMRKQTDEVTRVKREVSAMKEEMCVWKKRVEKLEDSVIDQQARSRRNNLMFYGVPEIGGNEDCKQMVRDLIVDKCGVSGAVRLERVHRVPPGERPAGGRPRPIVCKFLDYNEKMDVKKNSRQLPRDVRVADDLPKKIREARKVLMPDLKKARDEGKDAFIAFPARLIVNKVEKRVVHPGSADVTS